MARQKKLPNTDVHNTFKDVPLPFPGQPTMAVAGPTPENMARTTEKLEQLTQTPGDVIVDTRQTYSTADIVAKIQNQRITITGNKSGVFPGSDERYWWATEDLIMSTLSPVLQENNLQVLFGFITEGPIGMLSMSVRVIGSDTGELVQVFNTLPIGELKSNIDFTARCTTIRRDMLAMTFGVVVVPPAAVEPTPDANANAQLAPVDPAATVKPITAGITLTTTAPVTPPAPAQPETPYDIAARMINAAPNADNLEMVRTQVRNSAKLTQPEKDELLILSQRKYDQSFK
jgi:hypothetical protein